MPLDIAHPFRLDGHGDITTAAEAAHVEQMIYPLHFTSRASASAGPTSTRWGAATP